MTITEDRIITGDQMTVEEYLIFERDSETKHEYYGGEVVEMAGASSDHNRLAFEILRHLASAFEEIIPEAEVFASDQRVRATDSGPYLYPDGCVVLEKPIFDSSDCLTNPAIVIEVLSPSTVSKDRDDKFRAYRRISSLRHYVLVAQHTIRVEHFERLPGDIWALVGEHESLDDSLTFGDSGVSIPLAAIYRRVHFQS